MTEAATRQRSRVWRLCLAGMLALAALLFVDAGISKLLDLHTMPRAFAAAGWSLEAYMRASFWVGVAELVAVVGLAIRPFRRFSIATLLLLLAVFSILIAWNSQDRAFLADCGCGVASEATVGGNATLMLLRNTFCVLALLLNLMPRRGWFALMTSAVFALSVLLLMQTLEANHVRGISAHMVRENPATTVGWTLPAVTVLAEDGVHVSLASKLSRGGVAVFFSPNCGFCEEWAPRWRALYGHALENDSDLVLVNVDASRDAATFLQKHELTDLPQCTITDIHDLSLLGIRRIPHIVQVGKSGRTVWQTLARPSTGVAERVRSFLEADGLLPLLFEKLAGGKPVTVSGIRTNEVGSVTADVTTGGGEALQLTGVLVRSAPDDALPIELCMLVDEKNRVVAIRPLDWMLSIDPWSDPAERYLDKLQGLALKDAVAYATRLAQVPGHLRVVWHSIAGVMARAAECLE